MLIRKMDTASSTNQKPKARIKPEKIILNCFQKMQRKISWLLIKICLSQQTG